MSTFLNFYLDTDVLFFNTSEKPWKYEKVSLIDLESIIYAYEYERIRLFGLLNQVPILEKLLYLDFSLLTDKRIQLFSPLFVEKTKDSFFKLNRLNQFVSWDLAFGCSHYLSETGYTTYLLAYLVQTKQKERINHFLEIVRKTHPYWHTLRFLTPASDEKILNLLPFFYDVFWFIDRDRPSRLSRLYSFFGLNKRNAAFLLGKDTVPTKNHERFRLWADLWYFVEPPDDSSSEQLYLRNLFQEDSTVENFLKLTRRLVNFVFWYTLSTEKSLTNTEVSFDPLRFFKEEPQIGYSFFDFLTYL